MVAYLVNDEKCLTFKHYIKIDSIYYQLSGIDKVYALKIEKKIKVKQTIVKYYYFTNFYRKTIER